MKEYLSDKDFVIHVHDMAREYDSEMLRRLADRLDFMIEERKKNGKYYSYGH